MTGTILAADAHEFERLVGDVNAAGLDLRSLGLELREVDWGRAGAVAEARSRLVAILQSVASDVRELASAHGLPIDQVVRNILASVSRRSRFGVYLLLGARAVRLGAGDAGWRAHYLPDRPPSSWPGVLPLAWRLVATKTAPSPEELRVLELPPVSHLIASLLHARTADGGRLDAGVAFRDFFATSNRGAAVVVATPTGRRAESFPDLSRIASAWQASELAPLPLALLSDLPDDVVASLVVNPATRLALFGKRVKQARRKSGDETPRTGKRTKVLAAQLDEVDKLLPQLRVGGFATARVPRAALDLLRPTLLLRGAIRACLNAALENYPMAAQLGTDQPAEGDSAAGPRPTEAELWSASLSVLAQGPTRRAAAIVALEASARSALLTALPNKTLKSLYLSAATDESRASLLDACVNTAQGKRIFEVLKDEGRWLALLPASAVADAVSDAPVDIVWAALERHRESLPFEKLPATVARAVGAHLTELVSNGSYDAVLGVTASERTVQWLLANGGASVPTSFADLLWQIDRPDDDPSLASWTALARMLIVELRSLDRVVPHGVTQPAFNLLCRIVATVRPEWDAQLLKVTVRNSTREAWLGLVRSTAAVVGDDAIPSALYRAILTDPESLGVAAREAPAHFGQAALTRLPLTDLLRHAFVSLRFGRWLDVHIDSRQRRESLPWVRREFKRSPCRSAAYELAVLCSLADAHLLYRTAQKVAEHHKRFPDRPGAALDQRYRTYDLPKRSGGSRIITAPHPAIKRIQRRLLDRLFSQVRLHDAATGFRSGHSTATNAARHIGRRLVVNVDLESCFPSTKYTQILRACYIATEGVVSPRAVRLLAEICSYNGALPTGAPTSPVIANIVLRGRDHVIGTVAARFGITYTRYADDLTFSGDGDVHRILPFVERVLGEIGYVVAKHKVNLFRRGRRQIVTGLVVNEKPNLPRRLRRRLRAAVHARSNGRTPTWHGAPVGDDVLVGHLANLNVVQPGEAARLSAQLRATLKARSSPEESKGA